MFSFIDQTSESKEDLGLVEGKGKERWTINFSSEAGGADAKQELLTNGAEAYFGGGATFVPDPNTSDIVIMYVPTPGMAVIIIVVLR